MEEQDTKQETRREKRLTVAVWCAAAALILVIFAVFLNWNKKEEAPVRAGAMSEVSAMDIMCEPCGITSMPDGTLLVTDTYGKQIWQVGDTSTVYAGGSTVTDPYGEPLGGYNDALPEDSYFQCPWAITPFLDGYAVSDTENHVVRLVCEDSVQTVNADTAEDLPTTDMGVAFGRPTGLATDEEGNLYVADTQENAIRKITPEGDLSTFASDLSDPMGLCWKDGALYVAETGANRIVRIRDGETEPVAGCGTDGRQDGPADEASFSMPQGVAVGGDGTVYVSDTGNSAVRMVQDGRVHTLAARDVEDLESFAPVSPVGLLAAEDSDSGKQLYICDNFSRKVFVLSLL